MAKSKRQVAPRPKRSNGGAGTQIDVQQRDLTEKKEKVKAKMQQLTVIINEAPELKKKEEARRREILMKERTGGPSRNAATVLDDRFDTRGPSMPSRTRKSLKSERRQDRITFFGLLIALLLLGFWVWSIWR